jgi:hypothetical protein
MARGLDDPDAEIAMISRIHQDVAPITNASTITVIKDPRGDRLHSIWRQAEESAISSSAFTVRQFLVVATRENFFSMVVLVSLLLP